MRSYHWNGEYWAVNERSIWTRIRRWFAWFGGWEAHSPKNAYPGRTHRWSLRWRLTPKHLAPVSLLGHRFTYYGWGMQLRTKRGWWVYAWSPKREGRRLYLSHNGTPSDAHVWVIGTPQDIVAVAGRTTTEAMEKIAARNGEST